MIAAGPLISPWLAFSMAAFTMLVIAAHATALAETKMPESRRTIRKINAMLMLIGVPLIAYAFSGIGSQRPREFVFVWTAAAALLSVIVFIALVDILNTARLHRAQSQELRIKIRQARAQLAQVAQDAAHEAARRRQSGENGTTRYEPTD